MKSMAVGDIYETPPITKNKNITIEGGGTVLDWNIETEISFNRSEWELIAVAVGVIAQQSYTPLIPFQTVRLDVTVSARNYNGTYTDSLLNTGFLDWSLVDANIEKRVVIGRDIQGTATSKTALFITTNYKLPLVAVSPHNCNTSVEIACSFQSKVANPSSFPSLKPPREGGGAMNLNLWWLATVGAIAIVGLLALGFAAEKTGVNVGVVGDVWKGTTKAIGGFVSGVGNMVKMKA